MKIKLDPKGVKEQYKIEGAEDRTLVIQVGWATFRKNCPERRHYQNYINGDIVYKVAERVGGYFGCVHPETDTGFCLRKYCPRLTKKGQYYVDRG